MMIDAGPILMALGVFRFGVGNAIYNAFSQSAKYRWGSNAPLGHDPLLQYHGPGALTKTLTGTLYPYGENGGYGTFEMLNTTARAGQPLAMSDALGFWWGAWVITALEAQNKKLMHGNIPMEIDISVTLQAYHGPVQW